MLFFLFLVLFQVLVLNNIAFSGYLNPYVYILFIILLPPSTDRVYQLLIAFMLGLSIDLFENSGGVHIAATVLLAFLRRPILRLASQRQGQDFEELMIEKLPLSNQLIYYSLSIMLHHFALFMIESFNPADIGTVLVRTIASSLFTGVFIILVLLWRGRK
jgi:rod shape-determining protein MreD